MAYPKVRLHRDEHLPELFDGATWDRLATRFKLSKRQRQVARLICLGYSNPKIAIQLGLTRYTVALHVKELLSKLNANGRVSVVVRLVLAGREQVHISRGSRSRKTPTYPGE